MCCCLPSGSPSPSPRRRKSETRRPSETQVVRARSAVHPASSQEEPIVSKYARAGASGIREDVLIEELKDLRLQLQEERQKNTRLMGKLTKTAIDCCTVLTAPSVCASIPVLPLLCASIPGLPLLCASIPVLPHLCVHPSLYCPFCVCIHPCIAPSVCASIPVLPHLCVHPSLYCPICVCMHASVAPSVHVCIPLLPHLCVCVCVCIPGCPSKLDSSKVRSCVCSPMFCRSGSYHFCLEGGSSSVERICCLVVGMGSPYWLRARPSV